MDSVTANRVGAMLESLLFVPLLRPMIAGTGSLGDYELDLLAQEIAQHDRSGFATLIAANLERAR